MKRCQPRERPLWVIGGIRHRAGLCPLFPQKQTFLRAALDVRFVPEADISLKNIFPLRSTARTRLVTLNLNRPIGAADIPTKHAWDIGPCWGYVTSDRWRAF
jgi:hypothetical protein